MVYILGVKSISNLAHVHPNLMSLVNVAIDITKQDFGVLCGVRSLEDQRKEVAAGNSKTMQSKHLLQIDGFGHAVDLVPYINGSFQWDWEGCYKIAVAMQAAAKTHNVPIIWGGVWDKHLNDLSQDMEAETNAYRARHAGADFMDGPHYELA